MSDDAVSSRQANPQRSARMERWLIITLLLVVIYKQGVPNELVVLLFAAAASMLALYSAVRSFWSREVAA